MCLQLKKTWKFYFTMSFSYQRGGKISPFSGKLSATYIFSQYSEFKLCLLEVNLCNPRPEGAGGKKKKKQMVVVLLFLKLTLQKFRKVSVEKDWFTVAPLYTAAVIAEFPCASSAFGHLPKQNSILILLCFSSKCRQAWNPQGPRSAASQTRCGAMRVSLSLRFFPT